MREETDCERKQSGEETEEERKQIERGNRGRERKQIERGNRGERKQRERGNRWREETEGKMKQRDIGRESRQRVKVEIVEAESERHIKELDKDNSSVGRLQLCRETQSHRIMYCTVQYI